MCLQLVPPVQLVGFLRNDMGAYDAFDAFPSVALDTLALVLDSSDAFPLAASAFGLDLSDTFPFAASAFGLDSLDTFPLDTFPLVASHTALESAYVLDVLDHSDIDFLAVGMVVSFYIDKG